MLLELTVGPSTETLVSPGPLNVQFSLHKTFFLLDADAAGSSKPSLCLNLTSSLTLPIGSTQAPLTGLTHLCSSQLCPLPGYVY